MQYYDRPFNDAVVSYVRFGRLLRYNFMLKTLFKARQAVETPINQSIWLNCVISLLIEILC